jgi:hypothetical protein
VRPTPDKARRVLRLYHRSSDRTLTGRSSTSPASDRLNKVVDGRSLSSSPKFGMMFAASRSALTCLQLRVASSPLAACSPAPGPVVAQQAVCAAELPRSNLFPCPVQLLVAASSSRSHSPPLVPTLFSISEKYTETNSSKHSIGALQYCMEQVHRPGLVPLGSRPTLHAILRQRRQKLRRSVSARAHAAFPLRQHSSAMTLVSTQSSLLRSLRLDATPGQNRLCSHTMSPSLQARCVPLLQHLIQASR